MLDWTEVPSGGVHPYCCVVCRGTVGPMLDTHTEIPGYGRVYLCKNLCVRTGARVAGYAKGKRQNELLDAQTFAEKAEQREAALAEKVAELERHNAGRAERIESQAERIEYLEQRLAQVTAAAQENAGHLADVIGGGS